MAQPESSPPQAPAVPTAAAATPAVPAAGRTPTRPIPQSWMVPAEVASAPSSQRHPWRAVSLVMVGVAACAALAYAFVPALPAPPPSAAERAHNDAISALRDESALKRAASASSIDVAAAAAVAAQDAAPPPAPAAAPTVAAPATPIAKPIAKPIATPIATPSPTPPVAARAVAAPEDEEPADVAAPAGGTADGAELPARRKAKGLVLRAEAKIRARDQEGARRLLTRAAALDPTFADAWRDLGIVRATLGDAKGARLAYRKYLAVAPSAPDAAEVRRILREGAAAP